MPLFNVKVGNHVENKCAEASCLFQAVLTMSCISWFKASAQFGTLIGGDSNHTQIRIIAEGLVHTHTYIRFDHMIKQILSQFLGRFPTLISDHTDYVR